MKTLLITLALISLTMSYTYNLQTTSNCVIFNTTYNICTQWQQTGTINQDSSSSCFIGETLVQEKNKGYIQM